MPREEMLIQSIIDFTFLFGRGLLELVHNLIVLEIR